MFRTIALGVELCCEMILHDVVEHGFLRLATGIATRCQGEGWSGEHAYSSRRKQVRCHLGLRTIVIAVPPTANPANRRGRSVHHQPAQAPLSVHLLLELAS